MKNNKIMSSRERWKQSNAKFEGILNYAKISELYLEGRSQCLKSLKQEDYMIRFTGSDPGEGREEHRRKVGNHRPGSPLLTNILQLE